MFFFEITSQVVSWISEPGVLNHYWNCEEPMEFIGNARGLKNFVATGGSLQLSTDDGDNNNNNNNNPHKSQKSHEEHEEQKGQTIQFSKVIQQQISKLTRVLSN